MMINSSAQWSNTTNQFDDSLHMAVCTDVNTQQHPIVKSYPDNGYFVISQVDHNTALTKLIFMHRNTISRKSTILEG